MNDLSHNGTETLWSSKFWGLLLCALTLAVLLVHGFHPLAEDGGLYVAGVEYTLDPTLFPHYTDFVREHLRFSLFAPCVAGITRLTHIPLLWVLLLLDLFTIWLTLFAARQILRRCVRSEAAQLAGVALLAAWWTLPIAGTSLMLMDPYVTARSFSTPLSLLAIAFALDNWRGLSSRSLLCATCCFLAAILHPLMAGYAIALVFVLRASRLLHHRRAWLLFALLTIFSAALLQALGRHDSPAFLAAASTRYYWFLSQWQWFELVGLLGPLALLAFLLRFQASRMTTAAATLCRSCLVAGSIAVLIALFFAHESSSVHLVARLQVLRVYLLLYAIMAMLLGATIYDRCRQRGATEFQQYSAKWIGLQIVTPLFLVAMAAVMGFVQRQTFPASPHIELPWREQENPNPWVQAFLWCRANTPRNALFALDAKYINTDGEDAQTFRAISLRSALPDYSKDGGEAAITPALAGLWQQGSMAQRNLSNEDDATRDAAILPLKATWMVLHTSAITTHPCPYINATVKVCRLTP